MSIFFLDPRPVILQDAGLVSEYWCVLILTRILCPGGTQNLTRGAQMVFEVIPFAVCTAATGALGAGGWHIAMGNKGDSWSTCGGRGKGYSMKPERSTEEIAQALYATDGTKNENIGAERAHTGLSPRLSHVFETMAGTQNRNPKPPPLPPPKQHRNTPFKPEVDEKGKRVVSVAEGLRMAFRHDNIGPPQGHVPYAQPEPVAETTYDRYTRGRSSPIVERRSLSPSRPNTNSRRFSPDPAYGRRVSPGRRLSPDPGYGRRLSPSGRVERVAVQYAAPEAPPQPAWIQRVEVARDPPRDPRLQSLQQVSLSLTLALSLSLSDLHAWQHLACWQCCIHVNRAPIDAGSAAIDGGPADAFGSRGARGRRRCRSCL